jgi:hypothetical protein
MVYCNHFLTGDGRNHWAKTPIDFKVLAILIKNQQQKMEAKKAQKFTN